MVQGLTLSEPKNDIVLLSSLKKQLSNAEMTIVLEQWRKFSKHFQSLGLDISKDDQTKHKVKLIQNILEQRI